MRTQGLGAGPWADLFQGAVTQAADAYTERQRAKTAAAQLEAERRFQLAQTFPQGVLASTPGGGMGLLVGVAILGAVLLLSKGRR
jgi:hypothetical protein